MVDSPTDAIWDALPLTTSGRSTSGLVLGGVAIAVALIPVLAPLGRRRACY